MASAEGSQGRWSQNLALVVAVMGILGSVVGIFLSDYLRDQDQRVAYENQREADRRGDFEQTVALRRVAYDQFAAAVYEYNDSLENYRRAMWSYVDSTVRLRGAPEDSSIRSSFEQSKSELPPARDGVREQRTEVFKAQNNLGLIGTTSSIVAASNLLLACNGRLSALSQVHDLFATPDVLQWEPPAEVVTFHAEGESTIVLTQYNDALASYIEVTQTDVRPLD